MNPAVIQLQAQIVELDQKLAEAQTLLADPAMSAMAQDEINSINQQKQALTASLEAMADPAPRSPAQRDEVGMDHANAILEVRGGAGGEEAKLFAQDLLRMYLRYTETKKLKAEILDEGVIKFKGRGAYGLLKFESGVHRVQRVPVTESSGRIHTSTASVAVLPEIPVNQITIRDEDLEWKFTRAGGHGGQNVNKVNTAVMLTHTPSGLVVHCRQERFQQQNKVIALEILRSRLWEIEEAKRLSAITTSRREAVGRAMRSEKIRTYNYPENRVTDHRIPKTWKNLDRIIEGDLDPILDALNAPPNSPLDPAV